MKRTTQAPDATVIEDVVINSIATIIKKSPDQIDRLDTLEHLQMNTGERLYQLFSRLRKKFKVHIPIIESIDMLLGKKPPIPWTDLRVMEVVWNIHTHLDSFFKSKS